MMRDSLAADPARVEWGPRFFVDGEPDSVVGWGGFKGPPVDGTVEIGYEIAAGVQGRGFATAAARAMVIEAFASIPRARLSDIGRHCESRPSLAGERPAGSPALEVVAGNPSVPAD